MINFKALSIEDKELFQSFSKKIDTNSYEYLFSSLYLWRNFCHTSYCIIDGALIVRKFCENKEYFYMMPFGYKKESLTFLIKTLISDRSKIILYLFGNSNYNFINDIKSNTNFQLETVPDINCYEYVYLTEDLIKLTGSKYHKKRNHINNFIKNYNYTIKSIDSNSIIKDCLVLIDNWHKSKTICSKELIVEPSAIEDILYHIDTLNLNTIAIYVEEVLVGFAIGEKFNDTAIIHIERCDKSYLGSYAFLNRQFLIKDFSDTIYVNRQEDCGDPGIRASKQSYYPHHMVEKYWLKVR